MRHGDKINNLGRKKAHRIALLQNLTSQLIDHKRIFTTLAKAKALRQFAEPLLTKAKTDNTNNRRVVFAQLQDKEAIKELFGVIATKIADRPGGYTRIIKMPNRAGDAAEMAMIELVDFNELYSGKNDASASGDNKKKRTRRKTSTSKSETPVSEISASETTATDEDTITEETTTEETTKEDSSAE